MLRNSSWKLEDFKSICTRSFIVFLQCVSNAFWRRSMVLLFPVSSPGKQSLCFLSRLIYADGSLVIPVVCNSLQRFAGSNSRNKQFQSESRSVEGRGVCLWFSSAHYVSIRKSACYYSKVQAPAYIHNRRNAYKINKEVEKTFALVDNSNMTVSYN